jgi:TPP-dependent pyruvate/acetoin dehydrogenase alpha subunit
MNFAGVYRAPVLFLCRNNGYAISLPVARQTAVRSLAEKAAAYGVPASRVDGNDVLAVWRAVRDGVRRAAEGGGPSFIELMTYRMGGHSTSDDPRIYRDQEEVDSWGQADPLLRVRKHLEQRAAWSADLEGDWQEVCASEVKACVREAESKPKSELHDVFRDVYAEQPWHLREQEAECIRGARAPDHEEGGS